MSTQNRKQKNSSPLVTKFRKLTRIGRAKSEAVELAAAGSRSGLGADGIGADGFGAGTAVSGTAGRSRAVNALGLVLAAALALTVTSAPAPAHATSQSKAQKFYKDIKTIVDGTNAIRKAYGKKALKYDARISVVAYDWSVIMGQSKWMRHNGYYSKQIPKNWTRAGENVGYACGYEGNPQDSARVLVNAWKESPSHFDNLIGDFTSIGIGVYWDGNCMWATQNFGKYASPSSYSLPNAQGVSVLNSSTVSNTNKNSVTGTKPATPAKKSKTTVLNSYLKQIKAQNSSAVSVKSKANKSIKLAKKQRDQAKQTTKKRIAKAVTRKQAKLANSEYAKANSNYKATLKHVKSAQTAYNKAVKLVKAKSTTAKVKAQLSAAKSSVKKAKVSYAKAVKHQKKVSQHLKAAQKSVK